MEHRTARHRSFTAQDLIWLLFVALLLTVLQPLPAHSQVPIITGTASSNLTWQPPTQDENNAALVAGDLTGYAVYFGPQSRFSSGTTLRSGCALKPSAATDVGCYGLTRLAPVGNSFSFQFTISQSQKMFFALSALGKNGGISAYSNEVSKDFVVNLPVNPKAPASVTITVTVTCSSSDGSTCSISVQ